MHWLWRKNGLGRGIQILKKIISIILILRTPKKLFWQYQHIFQCYLSGPNCPETTVPVLVSWSEAGCGSCEAVGWRDTALPEDHEGRWPPLPEGVLRAGQEGPLVNKEQEVLLQPGIVGTTCLKWLLHNLHVFDAQYCAIKLLCINLSLFEQIWKICVVLVVHEARNSSKNAQ